MLSSAASALPLLNNSPMPSPPTATAPNTIIMHSNNDNALLSFRFIFLPPEFIFEPSLRAHLALMRNPLMNKDRISQNRFTDL